MGNHTSDKISKDTTTNLTREEKGVVSSVFAKVVEGKICKAQSKETTPQSGKCDVAEGAGSVSSANGTSLSAWFSTSGAGQSNGAYSTDAKRMEKWGEHNAGVVSRETTSNLSREERGVVSSVFAKVIEGAEILQRILSDIDKKICKQQKQSTEEEGKCKNGISSTGDNKKKFSEWFSSDGSSEWNGGKKGHEPWSAHNAINILDPAKIIEGKICKNNHAENSGDGKCLTGHSGSTSNKGLSKWFDSTNGAGAGSGNYTSTKVMEQWGAHNAGVVSKDTAELSREEKGVVSSVFAKVIDKKICKQTSTLDSKKCTKANGSSTTDEIGTNYQLSQVFTEEAYTGKETQPFTAHNAKIVSDDTAKLSREAKGVVSRTSSANVWS